MRRNGAILAYLLILLTLGFMPEAKARGFFDDVFGSGRNDPPAQFYYSPPRQTYHRRHAHRHDFHHRAWASHARVKHRIAHAARFTHHKRRVAVTIPTTPPSTTPPSIPRPCCGNAQEAINHIINNDPTLRPGDAYMSNEGLRVYVGERKQDAQFVSVDHARHIGAGLKQRLKDVVTNPSKAARPADDKVRNQAQDQRPSAARGARGEEKLVAGPAGRPIRLVGGFAK